MNQKGTNLLTLGREVRMPADIVYGSLDEMPNEPNQPSKAPVGSRKDEPAKYADTAMPDELPPSIRPKKIASRTHIKTDIVRSANVISSVEVGNARKPTPPAKPTCRRVAVRLQPQLIPIPLQNSRTEEKPRPKRRMELAPSVLAKSVASRPNQSSKKIAEELAATYGMPIPERRNNENIIRGMRAAERNLCAQLRRTLPFN